MSAQGRRTLQSGSGGILEKYNKSKQVKAGTTGFM
jgi:hypothetical protein